MSSRASAVFARERGPGAWRRVQSPRGDCNERQPSIVILDGPQLGAPLAVDLGNALMRYSVLT